MWNGKSISVIFPAYNEEENIENAIEDFLQPFIDEIIVVNNNSTDKTADMVRKTSATLINENRQGYGFAIRRGLNKAKGDYLIVCEPDGTFQGSDIPKFLIYADDSDFIVGTRTNKKMLGDRANMDFFMRLGNVGVGKLLSFLFNGPPLSDVGCTFRLIKRSALKKIENSFKCGGPEFSPEMIILALKKGIRLIEIPVHYESRIGISKITGKRWKAIKLGISMIALIFIMKLTNR
jgi:glycosyltransferase involved in cell wall biosynthesis